MTFDLKTVVLIVGWALTGAGLYYGLSAQIERQTSKLERQAELIQKLSMQSDDLDASQRAQERALIELTVTLRATGVVKP